MISTEPVSTPREPAARPREQKLVIYHPTSAGNGAAVQLEPRINRREGDRYNCFFLEMAAQKSTASRQGDQKSFATFDWEHKLTVKLDYADLCELLAVLEGHVERAGGARNGLYHENGRCNTMISFQKAEKGGLSRKDKATGQITRVQIVLSEAECIGLRCILQSGLFLVLFHAHLFGPPPRPAAAEAEAL
jgi:hypothetical protein